VVAISPKPPASADQAIHAPSDAHGKSPDSSRDGDLVVRFDEQMNVIVLHREMHDSKPSSRRAPKRPANLEEDDLLPQARDPSSRAQRHVRRMPRLVLPPRPMRHPLPPRQPRPPRPFPRPAPIARQRQRELNAGVARPVIPFRSPPAATGFGDTALYDHLE
jgi:hypothetical protein